MGFMLKEKSWGRLKRIRSRPQSGGFSEPQHDVHVLNGLAGGPFAHVVDGRHQDQAVVALIKRKPDIAIIGPLDMQRVGRPPVRADAYKTAAGIKRSSGNPGSLRG